MKKRAAIWIGVAVIAVAIIGGIASIPDEVLLENPSLETSENPTTQEPVMDLIVEEPTVEPIVEEPVEEPTFEEPTTQPIVEEPVEEPVVEEPSEETVTEEVEESEEESDGKTIKVEVEDGVGSADR